MRFNLIKLWLPITQSKWRIWPSWYFERISIIKYFYA